MRQVKAFSRVEEPEALLVTDDGVVDLLSIAISSHSITSRLALEQVKLDSKVDLNDVPRIVCKANEIEED